MFKHENFKCKCKYKNCDKYGDKEMLSNLIGAMILFQKDLWKINQAYTIKRINSGYRCLRYNRSKKIGSNDSSQHPKCTACDFGVRGLSAEALAIQANKSNLFKGIGLYNTFIHVDIRKHKARWDRRNKTRRDSVAVDF